MSSPKLKRFWKHINFIDKLFLGRYTETERPQHITRSDPRIFSQSYVANYSSVDEQAAFLGEVAQYDHITDIYICIFIHTKSSRS
jgi:hypothetical protein